MVTCIQRLRYLLVKNLHKTAYDRISVLTMETSLQQYLCTVDFDFGYMHPNSPFFSLWLRMLSYFYLVTIFIEMEMLLNFQLMLFPLDLLSTSELLPCVHFPLDKRIRFISLPHRKTMLWLVPPSDSVAAIYSCGAESQLT